MCQVEPRVPHTSSILIFSLYTLPHTTITKSVLHYQQPILAFQLNRLKVAKEDFTMHYVSSGFSVPCRYDERKQDNRHYPILHYIALYGVI